MHTDSGFQRDMPMGETNAEDLRTAHGMPEATIASGSLGTTERSTEMLERWELQIYLLPVRLLGMVIQVEIARS